MDNLEWYENWALLQFIYSVSVVLLNNQLHLFLKGHITLCHSCFHFTKTKGCNKYLDMRFLVKLEHWAVWTSHWFSLDIWLYPVVPKRYTPSSNFKSSILMWWSLGLRWILWRLYRNLESKSLSLRCRIAPSAYIPPNISVCLVCYSLLFFLLHFKYQATLF